MSAMAWGPSLSPLLVGGMYWGRVSSRRAFLKRCSNWATCSSVVSGGTSTATALYSGSTATVRDVTCGALGVPVVMPGVVVVWPVVGSVGWSLGFGMTIQRMSHSASIPPTTA